MSMQALGSYASVYDTPFQTTLKRWRNDVIYDVNIEKEWCSGKFQTKRNFICLCGVFAPLENF